MKSISLLLIFFSIVGCQTAIKPKPKTFNLDDFIGLWNAERPESKGFTLLISKESATTAKIEFKHNLNSSVWTTDTYIASFAPKSDSQLYDELQYKDSKLGSLEYITIFTGVNSQITIQHSYTGKYIK